MNHPRIPIENIYYLMCYAWDKLEEKETLAVDPVEGSHVIDLLGKVLANGTTHLLRRGLDRGYVAVSEESRTIRGRIDFAISIKRQLIRQARVHVEYDELSYDVLHNRILKSTLVRLAVTDDLDADLRADCHDLARRMSEVSVVELSGLLFRSVQFSRNTSFYELLIRVCELLYENLLPTEERGPSRFWDFERDPKSMWRLFQGFVLNFYKRHRSDLTVRGERSIPWEGEPEDKESEQLLPSMNVDVSLESPKRRVLIDTKFTPKSLARHPRSETARLRSEHLYQLYAYATNLAVQEQERELEAILLYPTVERELDVAYSMHGRRLRVATVNLASPWPVIHDRLLDIAAAA